MPPLNGFTNFRLPGVTSPSVSTKSSVTSAIGVQRRGESDLLHLPPHRLHHPGMAVAENGDEDAADRVEVALALAVPQIQTLGSLHDHGAGA